VKDAKVLKGDLMNTNGIIHVIDKVLMPATGGAEEEQPAEPLRGKKIQ